MLKDECHTLVGYHLNQIISIATIYYYDILPSNENPKRKSWTNNECLGR